MKTKRVAPLRSAAFPAPTARPTQAALAAFWCISRRSVGQWQRAGAPLHSTAEMLRWLATRQHLPAAVCRRVAEIVREAHAAAASPAVPDASTPAVVPALQDAGTQGAASALRRLETEELAGYARLQAELAKSPVDAVAVKLARDAWMKTSESLRRFDLLVEQSRRDTGELIPRAEWSRMARAIVFWFLHSINRSHDDVCDALVGVPDHVSAWRVMDAYLIDKMVQAFAFACRRESGVSLPAWAVDDMKAAMSVNFEGVEDAFAATPPADLAAVVAAAVAVAEPPGATPP